MVVENCLCLTAFCEFLWPRVANLMVEIYMRASRLQLLVLGVAMCLCVRVCVCVFVCECVSV